ncbi:hypothetical protein EHW67_03860 [Arenibacter aquaticus]|uniref:alpha-L-fucosidase n=1 Tax=Arenibacter aquaticus TaxID=2489054 RepID=A0A3S0INX3_9FLAO|nr:alpha-L-fucosidase [Arenibacter aquaticus]RTE54313.1 hypothetical protein EHW67_03860 [Arenibacter aquaticus]
MWSKNLFLGVLMVLIGEALSAQTAFENPIEKKGRLGSPLVETSPFVFEDKLYLLENNQRFWDVKRAKPGDYFHEDEVRIRDVKSDKIISVPLKNHGFGTALVWNDRVYVFAGDYGEGKPWRQITEISMTSTSDLKTWTKPQVILRAGKNEFFFNTAVCRGKSEFILLYETNDKHWKPFTFRYMKSTDLINWEAIPNAIYGTDKYVGGPALYYEGGWYYTLYLEALNPGYETRITRSKDLLHWEDADVDRPFITFDTAHKNIPLIDLSISESNASDVELCYYNGRTILYFTGSDQTTAGDLQWATYDGTPQQLFEHFFKNTNGVKVKPPEHQGDWAPVLTAPQDTAEYGAVSLSAISRTPTPQQLAFQERQMGAFIHFGPATYIESDFMSVPAADVFNPSQLNAEQWVKTAKSFGAKHIVLTAKHHNGYCLWPTKTTEYSVKQSPWKEGKGDVVSEFVKACRKYDIKVGLYISGGDKHFGVSSTPDPQGERKLVGDIHQYYPVFLEQLRELLTGYGDISYVWFDGAYDPFGWDVMDPKTMKPLGTAYGDAIRTMVEHLQPNAVVMGGTKPDVRWSGSEQGWAAYPLWNILEQGEGFSHWVGPQTAGYIPAEANIHPREKWFWTSNSDGTLRDMDYLKKVYLQTIGRGANILINMTPDTTGLIPQKEVDMLKELGMTIDKVYADPIGTAEFTNDHQEGEIYMHLPKKKSIRLLVLEEDLRQGQFIKDYNVEAYINGEWLGIANGQSIGRKRIQIFDSIRTTKLRLSYTSVANKGAIRSFTVYDTDF